MPNYSHIRIVLSTHCPVCERKISSCATLPISSITINSLNLLHSPKMRWRFWASKCGTDVGDSFELQNSNFKYGWRCAKVSVWGARKLVVLLRVITALDSITFIGIVCGR